MASRCRARIRSAHVPDFLFRRGSSIRGVMMTTLVRRFILFAYLGFLLSVCAGCGYRLVGKQMNAGQGRTLAIPTFTNRSTTYRIEQRLTDEVRREFIRDTKYRVVPDPTGDVVMSGEVLTFIAVPIIFDTQGRASSYSILVDLNVKLTDSKTGAILFQNNRWTFRDVFELSEDSTTFVPEDTPATERLARRFASSLVAAVLNAKP